MGMGSKSKLKFYKSLVLPLTYGDGAAESWAFREAHGA